ncbi:MAG TPA: efflux RND transporter periplasmic adaptor subunit [Methylomirabilota bacterium]|nr:efflux RND transporter periplasmic adaptor subunit [Methylomirabilota bacterium]
MRGLIAGLALLLLAACRGEPAAEAPGGQAPPLTGVRVETTTFAPLRAAEEVVGTVRTKTQMVIASKVQGYVREVRARQGDHVERGRVLVTVDDRELTARADRARSALAEAEMGLDEVKRTLEEAEAALRSAEADRAYAEATATRYRQLRQSELISAQDYETVETRHKSTAALVEQAQARIASVRAREKQMGYRIDAAAADLRAAEITLGETRIAAPATGVVVDRRVEPGDLAVPGQALLVLDDPRAYRLEASVGESAVGRVRLGERVPVVLDSLGRTLEGRVAEIIPAADPSTRTVTVKLDLPADPGLRSGLFGRARFPAGERQALLVPIAALVERGQLTAVYVVGADDVAHLRLVTAGARHADRVEILSGLAGGERVVVEGAPRVSDGARVAPGP